MGEKDIGRLEGLMEGVLRQIEDLKESNTSQHKTLFDYIDGIKNRLSVLEERVTIVMPRLKRTFMADITELFQNKVGVAVVSIGAISILLWVVAIVFGKDATVSLISEMLIR
ncbi:MAG: hypothetical protein AB1478_01755 [Nitrospirota bacterium]